MVEEDSFYKKIIHAFKELSPNVKISFVIILIVAVVGIIFDVFMWGKIFIQAKSYFIENYWQPLGFDFTHPMLIFISFSVTISVLLGITFLIWKKLNKEKEKHFLNKFIVFGIFLLLFIIVFGICLVSQSYSSKLPGNFTWYYSASDNNKALLEESNCQIDFLKCFNLDGNDDFVIGNEIRCSSSWLEGNCSAMFSSLKITKYYPQNNFTEESKDIKDKYFVYNFIVEENLRSIDFKPTFKLSNDSLISPYTAKISLQDKYFIEQYKEDKSKERYEKVFFLFTIISIGFLSTIVAMNNLKQLMEKKV
jgi:hypothetical protein